MQTKVGAVFDVGVVINPVGTRCIVERYGHSIELNLQCRIDPIVFTGIRIILIELTPCPIHVQPCCYYILRRNAGVNIERSRFIGASVHVIIPYTLVDWFTIGIIHVTFDIPLLIEVHFRVISQIAVFIRQISHHRHAERCQHRHHHNSQY